MSKVELSEVFGNPSVEAFGTALRWAVRPSEFGGAEDYASLVELEYTETEEDFVEVLKKFLRRYHSYAKRREKEGKHTFLPSETDLKNLMKLIDQLNHQNVNGIRVVRAALISHALVKASKKEEGE